MAAPGPFHVSRKTDTEPETNRNVAIYTHADSPRNCPPAHGHYPSAQNQTFTDHGKDKLRFTLVLSRHGIVRPSPLLQFLTSILTIPGLNGRFPWLPDTARRDSDTSDGLLHAPRLCPQWPATGGRLPRQQRSLSLRRYRRAHIESTRTPLPVSNRDAIHFRSTLSFRCRVSGTHSSRLFQAPSRCRPKTLPPAIAKPPWARTRQLLFSY